MFTSTLVPCLGALLLMTANLPLIQAQEQDTGYIVRNESNRLIYRGQWHEAGDLARISKARGFARAACCFNRSTAWRHRAEILSVGMVGSAVLGYMSTWQEGDMNPIAGGFLIAAGGSGLASTWYLIGARHSLNSGIRAFNRAVDIEQGRLAAEGTDDRRGPGCRQTPLLAKDGQQRMKHRFSPNPSSDLVVFDGQLMSLGKAATYADENHIAGAGDLLRELAALKNPRQGKTSSPVTLNDQAMRDYLVKRNQLTKALLQTIRRHNREVRKQP